MTREEHTNLKEGDVIRRSDRGHAGAPSGWETTVVIMQDRGNRPGYLPLEDNNPTTIFIDQWEVVSKQKREPKGFAKWIKRHD